jgi:myotubularin-related protein 1/2
MLILDPFYRTLKGFQILIEKEWISFGHLFAWRCGHSNPKLDQEISPVFVQWLDCVHQLLNQYPDAFEFTIDLLYFLSYHVNTCLYGTFLTNSEKERVENYLKFKTVSIWTDINENKEQFINKNYKSRGLITPSCAMYKIRFWEEYFLRWNPHYVVSKGIYNIYVPYL